ncbi:hypothetical protein [Superficieibacter sp.]|uniref:hypothetical protein n=1 Tax=Superficieibacter sp. TaxID=2303322 RepID=UPI0028A7A18F|nr:hypothetical protein [Superficieibacter sp.]
MRLEKLKQNNVLIENVWGYTPAEYEPFYLQWLTALKRDHRLIEYLNTDNVRCMGFCAKHSTLYEPFALHAKELYGDAIYWLETKGNYYFLIIANGELVSGSDRIVSQRFWIHLREQLKTNSLYQHLNVRELDETMINNVIENCVAHQNKLKKKRQAVIVGLALGGVAILILTTLLLKFI